MHTGRGKAKNRGMIVEMKRSMRLQGLTPHYLKAKKRKMRKRRILIYKYLQFDGGRERLSGPMGDKDRQGSHSIKK